MPAASASARWVAVGARPVRLHSAARLRVYPLGWLGWLGWLSWLGRRERELRHFPGLVIGECAKEIFAARDQLLFVVLSGSRAQGLDPA